jgi:hypothetical protein
MWRSPLKKNFTSIYNRNLWGSLESKSGVGSEISNSMGAKKAVERIIKNYDIQSIYDAPCGDFNWIQHTLSRDISYVGVDIVEPLIDKLNRQYGDDVKRFESVDLTKNSSSIPKSDLIICRDALVHLDFASAKLVLNNFLASGSGLLLVTSFRNKSGERLINQELQMNYGKFGWRPLDMTQAPFEIGRTLEVYVENTNELLNSPIEKLLILFEINQEII